MKLNMATMQNKAVESTKFRGSEIERIVNRWLVDYYLSLALKTFRDERYSDFCEIRDILDGVLSRPFESTDSTSTKIRVLQFLSRINDGENLDYTFDSDESVTPLESAMGVFETISQECNVSQQDLERIHISIREMLVVVCIKNKEFDKAKEILAKHFPKGMAGKKAKFMNLINNKRCKHDVLDQVSFQQFKYEMVQFCESLYPASVPFLHQAAKQLVDKRPTMMKGESIELQLVKQNAPAASTILQEKSDKCKLSNRSIVQQKRLEAMYMAMAEVPMTFAQLEEEVEQEAKEKCASDPESMFLCLSVSPMEGTDEEPEQQKDPLQKTPNYPIETFAADVIPPEVNDVMETAPLRRNSQVYTVARLVLEPDSQVSEQDSLASQEQVSATRLPEQVQLSDSQEDPLSPVSTLRTPTRRHRKRLTSKTAINDMYVFENSDNSPPQKRVLSSPKSSTPQRLSPQIKTSDTKWQQLFKEAKETKEQWHEEDSLFNSHNKTGSGLNSTKSSGHTKRQKWTASETNWLAKGVQKYGEGQWEKIRIGFPFEGRTAVNLKDRWRTMKKLNLV